MGSVPSHYEPMYSDDQYCGDDAARVMVYPNSSYARDECDYGGKISSSLQDAFDQLTSYGSIWNYTICMFDVDKYGYPKIDDSDLSDNFEDWLTTSYKNNTGDNLYDNIGIHLLVYSASCSHNTAGGEHADGGDKWCDDEDYWSAFSTGVKAWTPVTCFNDLDKNSAIQETIYGFIQYREIDSSLMGGDVSTSGEHKLGHVQGTELTPMLSYHEDTARDQGHCDGDDTNFQSYTQDLTSCTKKAVEQTRKRGCTTNDYC